VKLYLIDEAQLAQLRRASTRLHSENRMDGDTMRDMGHMLEAIVRTCEQLELPEEEARP
jgi:hypothetical protein